MDSHHVNAEDLPWRPSPYPGVQWKKLYHDGATGRSAVLLKFEPGAAYGAHRHPGGEEYYVLDGSLEDGGATWSTGSYVSHPPGSVHRPSSREGCTLFVRLPEPVEITDG